MVKIGTLLKFKISTLKQQRENAKLELIIEEFGRAMRNAHKAYIAQQPACSHENGIRFTLSMWAAWKQYVDFCVRNPHA